MEKTNRFGNYKPEDFIIELTDSMGNTVKYMKNQGRIIAFRNEYPEGKIRIEVQFFSDILLFMAKAYIYADKTDHMDNYLACDVGSRIFKDNNSLPEAATQAISRALGRCGFGTAYASPDENDGIGDLSEAGIIPKELVVDTIKPDTITADSKKDDVSASEIPAVETKKSKRGRKPKAKPVTDEVIEATVKVIGKEGTAEAKVTTATAEETDEEITPETAPVPSEVEETSASQAPDVEEPKNIEEMTLEEARKVMIPFGQKKGQFMGEVFATDPNAVRWYAEKYSGDNELVRKAAQVILAAQK